MDKITLDAVLQYASPTTLASLIKDCQNERTSGTANEISHTCWNALCCNVGDEEALVLIKAVK